MELKPAVAVAVVIVLKPVLVGVIELPAMVVKMPAVVRMKIVVVVMAIVVLIAMLVAVMAMTMVAGESGRSEHASEREGGDRNQGDDDTVHGEIP